MRQVKKKKKEKNERERKVYNRTLTRGRETLSPAVTRTLDRRPDVSSQNVFLTHFPTLLATCVFICLRAGNIIFHTGWMMKTYTYTYTDTCIPIRSRMEMQIFFLHPNSRTDWSMSLFPLFSSSASPSELLLVSNFTANACVLDIQLHKLQSFFFSSTLSLANT